MSQRDQAHGHPVHETGTGRAVVGLEELQTYLVGLGLALDDVSLRTLASEVGAVDDAFELRLGQWRINLPTAIARGLVNGAVLTAALAAKGESSLTATVLSVIVPLVFDLDHIDVSASDRTVYAHLARDAPTRKHVDEWYDDLPADVRSEVTRLEFVDIIERLDAAGAVETDLLDVVTVEPLSPRRRRLLRL